MSTKLASTLKEFEGIRLTIAAAFDLDARLPGMVFRSPAPPSLFFEYEALFAADFWPALTTVAAAHADQVVDLIVLEPSTKHYYIPEYKMYPGFSLPVQSHEDCYWDVLNEEPNGDVTGAVVHSADVVALAGPSGRWGVWGDRGLGIAVVQGMPGEGSAACWRDEYGPFLSVQDALVHYIAPNFGGQVPSALSSAMLSSFADNVE